MSFRFRPEHFEILYMRHVWREMPNTPELYATQANYLLDKHVATLPEIGGRIDLQFGTPSVWTPLGHDEDQVMRARLWGVEEIKPKKCEHGRLRTLTCKHTGDETAYGAEAICDHCGKRLVAKWEEAD